MPHRRKKYRERVSRLGFVDIEMRDEENTTVFKRRGQKLGRGIKEFEKFLEEKFGIKGFSAFEETDYQKKQRKKEKEEFF